MTLNTTDIESADGYAGDMDVHTAYAWWQAGHGVLIDVRSSAEKTWVGFVPGASHIPWAEWFPSPGGMQAHASFESSLRALIPSGGRVLFLCRSGVRSVAAAKLATNLGFEAYNIRDGFEGPLDAQGQRNHIAGWRWAGLPWQQS